MLQNMSLINGWNDPNYPQFANTFALLGSFNMDHQGVDRGTNVGIQFKGNRWWNIYIRNNYPSVQSPGTMKADYFYNAPNPDGPWMTLNGKYKIYMEAIIQDTLYAETVMSASPWAFPLGVLDTTAIYQRDEGYNPEMIFTRGALPNGIGTVYLDVENGQLNMTVHVTNPYGGHINGVIPIFLNGTKIFDITVVTTSNVGLPNEPPPAVSTSRGAKTKYRVGDYILNAEVVEKITLTYDGAKYPYFQFGVTLCSLRGNTFKVTQGNKLQRVVLRQWVNPCYAVDSYMQIPGIGYYKKYTTTMNYSFPAVFGSVYWIPWDTRPDLSGRQEGKYFPQTKMMRDSYSGPCTAVVEEAFSPDGTWPKGWGLGTSVQFTTNSGYFSSPLCDYRLPACLHGPLAITVTIGNQDAKWLPGAFNTNFPGTTHTDWKPVTSYYASPWNGGMMCKKVTIYPPS